MKLDKLKFKDEKPEPNYGCWFVIIFCLLFWSLFIYIINKFI